MKNWIRIGNHYVNMDLIIEILRGENRYNWRSLKTEPCVVFIRQLPLSFDGTTCEEIVFWGEDAEKLENWLGNDFELEVTNLNFIDTAVTK